MSDLDNCSIHGLCFDNGQCGRCNSTCELFQDGMCEVPDDIIEMETCELSSEEINEILEEFIEPVKLFTLRGTGKSDYDLLREAYGYQ